MKLDGQLERGWRFVFQPLAMSYGALSVVSFAALVKILHHKYSLGPYVGARMENLELMRRLVLWRNLCECAFKLLQSVGLYSLVVLLSLHSFLSDAFSSFLFSLCAASTKALLFEVRVDFACEIILSLSLYSLPVVLRITSVRSDFLRTSLLLSDAFLSVLSLSVALRIIDTLCVTWHSFIAVMFVCSDCFQYIKSFISSCLRLFSLLMSLVSSLDVFFSFFFRLV